jgi:hypothetical protein
MPLLPAKRSASPATGQRERLVFDFANLADASKEAFLEFARKWGVLGLCEHKRPVFHQVPPCLPRRMDSEFVEPIAYWRNRARYIRAILNVKASLKRDSLGARSDWKTIWPGRRPADRTQAAKSLAIVTNILLSEVNVQPALAYVNNRLTITFVGGNFFDLLKAMSANEDINSWLSTSGTLLAEIAVARLSPFREVPAGRFARIPNVDVSIGLSVTLPRVGVDSSLKNIVLFKA